MSHLLKQERALRVQLHSTYACYEKRTLWNDEDLPLWSEANHWGCCGQSCPCCRYSVGDVLGSCAVCDFIEHILPTLRSLAPPHIDTEMEERALAATLFLRRRLNSFDCHRRIVRFLWVYSSPVNTVAVKFAEILAREA